MPSRIYTVRIQGQAPQLVRAHHPSSALAAAVKATAQVEVASQDDLVDLVAKGVKVIDAGAEPPAQAGLPLQS